MYGVSTAFIIATFILGIITLYLYRDRLGDIEEDQKKEQIEEEEKRKEKFAGKFPRINKIPIFRNTVRWMYKEGWIYSIILVIIILWGGFLIFHNLGSVDFYHDEFFHVSVIESLRHGEGFTKWDFIENKPGDLYNRGYLTNWFGYQFSRLFGYNEFSLRLFIAIIGLLNISLVYIIFKKFIGKTPALLTTIGFTFSILALYLTKFLRPYTVFLFFYILSFYLTYNLISQFFEKFSFKKVIVYIFLLVLCVALTFQASQLGKFLLLLIPLYLLSYYIIKKEITLKTIKTNKKILFTLLITLLLVFIVTDYFKVTNLSSLPRQINNFISFDRIQNPTEIYYGYIFEKYIKLPLLMYILYGLSLIHISEPTRPY